MLSNCVTLEFGFDDEKFPSKMTLRRGNLNLFAHFPCNQCHLCITNEKKCSMEVSFTQETKINVQMNLDFSFRL